MAKETTYDEVIDFIEDAWRGLVAAPGGVLFRDADVALARIVDGAEALRAQSDDEDLAELNLRTEVASQLEELLTGGISSRPSLCIEAFEDGLHLVSVDRL